MSMEANSEDKNVASNNAQRDLVETGSGRSILTKESTGSDIGENNNSKVSVKVGTDSNNNSIRRLVEPDNEETINDELDGNNTTVTEHIGSSIPSKSLGQNVAKWNPIHTRVFDVYINDESQNNRKLPDVFQYQLAKPSSNGKKVLGLADDKNIEMDPKHQSNLLSSYELINTGNGRKVSLPSANGMVYKKKNHLNNDRTQDLSLSLEQRMASTQDILKSTYDNTKRPSQLFPTPISSSLSSSAALANGLISNDKWPPHVESAFITSLQMIMKNGTAKIKIKDKNYGRNELISMYIKNRTGEKRSKKQISSHIQVWKKSITNKIQNGAEPSALENELLQLIEHGAEQTAENWQRFEETFNRILDVDENSSTDKSSISTNRSSVSLPINGQDGLVQTQSQQLYQYSNMQLPHSLYFQSGGNVPMLSYHVPIIKEPSTPLEYAQEVYGNLKSFKCVPVNPYEQYYPISYTSTMPQHMLHSVQPPVPTTLIHPVRIPSQSDNISGPVQTPSSVSESSKHIYQAAKEVEYQQKKLIEEIYNKQDNHVLPQHPYNQYAVPLTAPIQNNFPGSAMRRPILPPASRLGNVQPNTRQ